MKIKIFVSSLIAFMIMCISSVYAQKASLDVTVRANLDGNLQINIDSYSKLPISVGIMNDLVDETMTEIEKLENMVFLGQSYGENADIVFKPVMLEKEYYALVSDYENTKLQSFVWHTPESANVFFESIKSLSNDDLILSEFEKNKTLLDLYCGDYTGLSMNVKKKIAKYFSSNMSTDLFTFIEDMEWIKDVAKIGEINDSVVTEQNNEFDDILNNMITSGQLTEFEELQEYLKSDAETRTVFVKHFNDRYALSKDGFIADFKDLWYRTSLELMQNYSQVRELLQKYHNSSVLNIDSYFSIEYTKNLDKSLVGKYFSDKKELEKYVVSLIRSNKGSGGNSSGGGKNYTATINSTPTKNITSEQKFNDVRPDFWGIEAINVLTARGIISGYPSGDFCPNDNITRAEFLKIILEAFSFVENNITSEYRDVSKDSWYSNYVATGQKYGVIKGYDDNTFRADESIIRQDAACMLVNLTNVASIPLEQKRNYIVFKDDSLISDYAYDSIVSMYSSGVINGYPDNTFAPKGNLTRAEAVQMIFTLIKETA